MRCHGYQKNSTTRKISPINDPDTRKGDRAGSSGSLRDADSIDRPRLALPRKDRKDNGSHRGRRNIHGRVADTEGPEAGHLLLARISHKYDVAAGFSPR